MNEQELIKKLDELVAAGVLSEEEAEAKRVVLRNKEKERLEKEEADRLAAEAEQDRLDKEAKEAAAEIIANIDARQEKEHSDWIEAAFEELVPAMGKAKTVAGEIVRAMMRVLYRDYNDGDVFYEGYGLETCAPSACYLMEKLPEEIGNKFYDIAEEQLTGVRYTDKLNAIAEEIGEYLIDIAVLFNEENEDDSRNWDTDLIEGYVPTYDYECSFPDKLRAHIDKGHITESDIEDEISYWEYLQDADIRVGYGWNDIEISNLKREDYDGVERYFYGWLEDFAEDLTKEYGDPYFDGKCAQDDIREQITNIVGEDIEPKEIMLVANILYKYINDGDIWEDFKGKDEIEVAENIVDFYSRYLKKFGMDEYAEDFIDAGYSADDYRVLCKVLMGDKYDPDWKWKEEK